MKKTLMLIPFVILLMALVPMVVSAADPVTCQEEVVVVKDDWLAKYADKYFGNPYAWPAIFELHNQAAEADPVKLPNKIINPNLIEVGWTICIPTAEDAEAFLATYEGDQPKYGGTLHMGFEGAHEYQGWSWQSEWWHPDGGSHNMLIRVKDDLSELIPELATKWEVSADGKTYTFHLRDDVKWHDGQPFTADDVIWTYTAILNPQTGTSWGAAFFGGVEGYTEYKEGETDHVSGLKKIDDYTVEITFTGPAPINLWWIGYLFIFPEHILGDVPFDQIKSHEYWQTSRIGTGPFKFVSYTPKQSIVYDRNDEYWGQKAYIDRIIWHIYDNNETALLALEKGEIDTWAGYTGIPISEIPRFQAMPHINVMPGPSGVTVYMMIAEANPNFPWGAEKEFRQAVAHCIDKDILIETLWAEDYAEKLDVSILQPQYVSPNLKTYEYDPDKAKQLLDSINYDYNYEIELNYYYGANFWLDTVAAMQAQMSKCGLSVKPALLDGPSWGQKFNENWNTAEGFMLGIAGHGIPHFPDDHFVLFQTEYPEGRNVTGWRNEQFDDLVAQVKQATDEEERIRLYHEIGELLAEELPEIPLWVPHRPPGVNVRVQNSRWGPNFFAFYENFQDWWLKQD